MEEVFAKIIEKMKSEAERWEGSGREYNDRCGIAVGRGLRNAIKTVRQTAAEYEECHKDCGECEAYDKEKHHCPKFFQGNYDMQ